MQLYSELYNCYYNIIHSLLSRDTPFSREELISVVSREGFDETMLYLIPKIDSGEWNFFKKEGNLYVSALHNRPGHILSTLQKRWLKTLLFEPRIRLFLDDDALACIDTALDGVEPLYSAADFHVYDRFADGDDYADGNYRKNFRMILSAIESGQYLNISFHTHRNNRKHYWYLPCKLEYSVKNDRFRLLALEMRKRSHFRLHIINLSRIEEITETGKFAGEIPDINAYITKEYNKEPVTLLITNERNALERAMLQFANYKKNTVRIDDSTYQCEIYYNKSNETELLIEVLSFGSAIRVTGNAHFLELMRERLLRQRDLLA